MAITYLYIFLSLLKIKEVNPISPFEYYCDSDTPQLSFDIETDGKSGDVIYEFYHNNQKIFADKLVCENGKTKYNLILPTYKWNPNHNTVQLKLQVELDFALRALSRFINFEVESKSTTTSFNILSNNMENWVLICGDKSNPAFYVMSHEVSISDYERSGADMPFIRLVRRTILDSQERENPKDYYPVLNVNWEEAQCYCEKLDARLPTAREWEVIYTNERNSMVLNEPFNCPQIFIDRWNDPYLETINGTDSDPNNDIYNIYCNAMEWCYDWEDESKALKKVKGAGGFMPFNLPKDTYARNAKIGHDSIGFRCLKNLNIPLKDNCK